MSLPTNCPKCGSPRLGDWRGFTCYRSVDGVGSLFDLPLSLCDERVSHAETRRKLETLEGIIKDPGAVYVNMLRGEIAMPMTVKTALRNYTKSERAVVCAFDGPAHTVTLKFETMPITKIGESWAVVTPDATRTWAETIPSANHPQIPDSSIEKEGGAK